MTASSVTAQSRVRPSVDTLARELDGQLVFLQLETEAYFGLDEVGTRMWQCLTDADSVGQAIEQLASEFEVDRDELTRDVLELTNDLVNRRLLIVE